MLISLTPIELVLVNVGAWPIVHLAAAWIGTRIQDDAFRPDAWLYRERRWEGEGRLYEKLFRIKSWKDMLPDGAALFTKGFRKKRLLNREPDYLRRFRCETCRSEAVHEAVVLSSLLFFLWNPAWVGGLMVLYALVANLPCILTQRYNRIRLSRLVAPPARDLPLRPSQTGALHG